MSAHTDRPATHAAGLVVALAALIAALAATPAVHAAPRKDLVSLLPQDTAAVIRVTGLRAYWDTLENTPLHRRIEFSPIPEVAAGFANIRNGFAQFEQQHATNLVDTISAIFGQDALIALFPDGTGLFAARGNNPNALLSAVETITFIEQNEGKVRSDTTALYRGAEIRSMLIAEGPQGLGPAKERHHVIVGDVLIVSRSLDTVKKTLLLQQENAPTLAASKEYLAARRRMQPNALATVYLDTRLIAKTGLADKLTNGQLHNPVFRHWYKRIKDHLAATRHMVISLTTSPTDWRLASSFVFDERNMPPALAALLPPEGAALDIANLFPPATAAAVCNRVNKTALWKHTLASLQQSNPQAATQAQAWAQQLGAMFGAMDFEKELLSQLGDQAALFVTPGGQDTPPALCLAIETANGSNLTQTLRTWAGTIATLNQMEAAKKKQPPRFSLEQKPYRNIALTTLRIKHGPLARSIAPTAFRIDNFIVICTSDRTARAAIDAFSRSRAAPRPTPPAGTPITRGLIDIRLLALMIEQNKPFLVGQAMKNGKPRETALKDLRNVAFLMSLFDRVTFAAAHTPGCIQRTCTIHLASE